MLTKFMTKARLRLVAKESVQVISSIEDDSIAQILIGASCIICNNKYIYPYDNFKVESEKAVNNASLYSYDDGYRIYLCFEDLMIARQAIKSIAIPYLFYYKDIYIQQASIWCVYFGYFLNNKISTEKKLLVSLLKRGVKHIESVWDVMSSISQSCLTETELSDNKDIIISFAHKIPHIFNEC